MPPADLHREVVKLLVQVAWADREVTPEERDHIMGVARASSLSDAELADLRQALEDPAAVAAPDLDVLRRYRQDVKRAVLVLIRMDRRIAPEEAQMLASIDRLLDG